MPESMMRKKETGVFSMLEIGNFQVLKRSPKTDLTHQPVQMPQVMVRWKETSSKAAAFEACAIRSNQE
jgi:hypothetical protein